MHTFSALTPSSYIIAGTTRPFPTYKKQLPPTKKHYIFEYVISGKDIFIGEYDLLRHYSLYFIKTAPSKSSFS
jgi:hypothetical protein